MNFDFIAELTSGQCSIYGQWFAIISAIIMIVLSPGAILEIFLFDTEDFVQGIVNLCLGIVIILLEIPIFMRCLPSNPKIDEIVKFFEKNLMRAILYLCFAIIDWIFEFSGSKISLYLITSITLTLSGLSYGIATMKKEERVTSSLTGTTNFVDLATRV